MRAKRSKKYRKLMHQYELTFGFREPYQVLVDANFLHAVDSFKMDLIPALERTLQGKVKPCQFPFPLSPRGLAVPFAKDNSGRDTQTPPANTVSVVLTKCSLAAVMAAQPINPKTNQPYRPHHLPPPTTLPLRHCSHNEDSTPIDELDCLMSLLSPNADAKKNKEHYILATADAPAAKKNDKNDAQQRKRKRDDERKEEQAQRRARALRLNARSIPGVPIVYVKRSVMVLEPMSMPSETVRDGVERGKFRAGLDAEPAIGKRKRDGEGDAAGATEAKKKRGPKTKGPNPLSMKKPKKRDVAPGSASTLKKDRPVPDTSDTGAADASVRPEGDDSGATKPKRKRRHHKGGPQDGNDEAAPLE
ncbi:rRNA processing protein [Penicillium alfredii]|uniref:rRNA processing protein n=1 Tax=Penicillium alfredii TaxID=1506179 RepID=A0A9W9GB46_9EURO|nr:rRNA processing protein [Penicillium alfredii]KAJ5115249.1 rRNA processing protein [Penicillium alfredii]